MECIEAGFAGCVCAMAILLRPEWLSPDDGRYSADEKCYTGNPLDQIMGQIGEALAGPFEALGNAIGNAFASLFGWVHPGNVEAQRLDDAAKKWCSTSNNFGHGDADECYYRRVCRRM